MTKEMVCDSNQSTLELKKHVAVIHSNSKISLLQRKISNGLLFHAYDNLLTKEEHEIQITTLIKLIGYDSHDHKKIKQALMDLLATVVEWNLVDGDKLDKEQVWNASSIIADASIDGSLCTYSYSGKMRKLLYHPSVYGRLNMRVQSKFQSNYGLALYENCNRYQDIGQTPWFEIYKFRKLMGVDDSKYKIFRDLKTRVIDKSVEEVNKYSSLIVEPKFKKQNRQVIGIQFSIKNRVVIEATAEQSDIDGREISAILKNTYGLSQTQIRSTLKTYDEDYIKEKITIVEQSTSYLLGKIKNLGKYLLCALADDYQPIKRSNSKTKKVNFEENKQKPSENTKILRTKILNLFEKLNNERQKELIVLFEIKIRKTVYSISFDKHGIKDPLVNDQFVKFILSFKNEISEFVSDEIATSEIAI